MIIKFQHKQWFKTGKNNIIINYGILTTGFDSPMIESLFITRPTQSIVLYSQMIGRGLRGPEVGGTKECIVVDVIGMVGSLFG
mgnify:CR=1 FL=1